MEATIEQRRELEAWIAEHVMGWRKVEGIQDYRPGTFTFNSRKECTAWDFKGRIFKPTEDPAAAFEVLKRCKDVCIQYKINSRDEWCAGTLPGDKFSTAETLEIAICLLSKELFK